MEETPINADNFDTICRACLSDLKGDIAFNMYSFLIQENVIADVLSQCAAIQVRTIKRMILSCINFLLYFLIISI